MNINFVIDKFIRTPTGGLKVIYQYSNYLSNLGNNITLSFCIREPMRKYKQYIPFGIRNKLQSIVVLNGPTWFDLSSNVHIKYFNKIDEALPDSDLVIATTVTTAKEVSRLSNNKGKKYYLIQDFENWEESDEYVISTYQLGMTNIAVSEWLYSTVKHYAPEKTLFVKNGLDLNVFKVIQNPRDRNPFSVALLYHNNPNKGFKYAYGAVLMLKKDYPQLKCIIFGTPKRAKDWPDWIVYKQNANERELVSIYNQSAIFINASIQEGFGLCGAESMACGCALVSTNYKGVLSYARNGYNSLLSPVEDSFALYKNAKNVIENNELRLCLSLNGQESIKKLSIETACKEFSDILNEKYNT